MTAISLTRDQLIALDPCDMEDRLKLFGRRKSMNAAQALKAGASIDDLLWVAGKLGRKDLCVRFALACAQRVAHLNPDPRVQAALDATAAWIAEPSEANRAAAWDAAWGAGAAAWDVSWSAARDAREAARDAGAAAARAARDAAGAAARDVSWSAARDDAREAARDAGAAAARAARDAAGAAEREAQITIFLEIFGDKAITGGGE